MKNIKSYQEFLNEDIHLIKIVTTGDTNLPRKRTLSDKEIIDLLENPNDFTDDELIYTTDGKQQFIDDLEGKTIYFKNKRYSL